MNAIDVLVVESVPLLRDSIRDCLARTGDIRVIKTDARGFETDIAPVPDVVVADLATIGRGTSALAIAARIRTLWPNTAILALVSNCEDAEMVNLVEAGVVGLLRQTVQGPQLAQAVRTVYAGELVVDPAIGHDFVTIGRLRGAGSPRRLRASDDLTDREKQVLRLAAGSMRNREVALRLGISERTVRTHLESVFSKFRARSRTEAVLIGLQRGWLTLCDLDLAPKACSEEPDVRGSGSPGKPNAQAFGIDEQMAAGEGSPASRTESEGTPFDTMSRHLLNDLDEGCLLVQGERYVFVNSRMADTLGYSQQELVGKSVVSIVPQGLRQAILRLHRMRLAGLSVPSRYDLRCVGKSGETIPATLSVRVTTYLGSKAVVGVFSRSGAKSMSEASILRWLDRLPGPMTPSLSV